MKARKWLIVGSAMACALWVASCATHSSSGKSARRDALYLCGCGPTCKCETVSVKPGKCGCGHDLVAAHALKVEGDQALLCGCAAECTCTLNAQDPTKCSCGKAVRKASLKGTGIYFCNCGGSCTCNTFSDKPAQCKCGMPLKRAT